MIPGPVAFAERLRDAEACPHAEARARAVVILQKPGREMALCHACLGGFRRIIAAWNRHELAPRQVVAQVAEMGYSRRDACAFLLGLVADRLGVRLGFREAA